MSLPLGLSQGEGESPGHSEFLGDLQPCPTILHEGMMSSWPLSASVPPPSALEDRELEGGAVKSGRWGAVGAHQPPVSSGQLGPGSGCLRLMGSETPEDCGMGEGEREEAQGRNPGGS